MNDTHHFPDESFEKAPAEKPEMTRSEATFHASVAGVRAAEAAKSQGNDPAALAALGTAAVGGVEMHGLTLALPSAYSALAVPALSTLMGRHGLSLIQLQSDCLFIAAFTHPREVYRLAVTQGDQAAAERLLAFADGIALQLETRERIDDVVAWCLEAFQRLNGVKKPSVAEEIPGPPATAAMASSRISPKPETGAARDGSSPSSMS